MTTEIDRLTKKIWEDHKHDAKEHHGWRLLSLGLRGGYTYSIMDTGKRICLIHPFANPLKYLSNKALHRIMDILVFVDREGI